MKQDYDDEAKLHIIRRNLKLSKTQFDVSERNVVRTLSFTLQALGEEKHDEFLSKELWNSDVFNTWKREREEEEKIKLAQSGKYKSYRRYMKKGGPGQMTFAEE